MPPKKDRESPYFIEPILQANESIFRQSVEECFDSKFFDCKFVEESLECINVYVSGLKGLDEKLPDYLPQQCLHFSLKKQKPQVRLVLKTCFIITIHAFQTCASPKLPSASGNYSLWYDCWKINTRGHTQNILSRMTALLEMLEKKFPGEYVLELSEDKTMWDDDEIKGLNMRILYTLAHGESHLHQMGFHERQSDLKQKFGSYLNEPFILVLPQNRIHLRDKWTQFKKLANFNPKEQTKIQQVFIAVYKCVSSWNDELRNNAEFQVDADELDLLKHLLDCQEEKITKKFPKMFSNYVFDMERKTLVLPENTLTKEESKICKGKTLAEQYYHEFYGDVFPAPVKTPQTTPTAAGLVEFAAGEGAAGRGEGEAEISMDIDEEEDTVVLPPWLPTGWKSVWVDAD